jgi:hypothetical protein
MKKTTPAANPDAYVAALDGWRRERVEALRATVRAASALEEVVKWGNLVYLANTRWPRWNRARKRPSNPQRCVA